MTTHEVSTDSVDARIETLSIPTFGLGEPERNPLFFEKRVYQGSCGKVYPVPFIDKVYQDDPPKPLAYQSVRMENRYLRLVMLPEIGGRILIGQDRTNRDYDFFYRQDVIKPALVGLAGPWISGGVEFNWPQHHRPGTYMPADVRIETEPDGAQTAWFSEHDPLNRLKGMHGIRLRPGSSLIELRGRLYNRTPLTATFLWWANVAARVHDNYQSFFPEDVHYVADHAVRAMSSFPISNDVYYGVNYADRPGANDLRWYKNIPVPTSYMVCETEFGFFGGYDYDTQGGFVHVADRHISPGKKQWTWGNHEFGWAWDRELTDTGGPYVELMAGVYTDNQPDFSYLLPYETKTFSQYWWPYQKIGPVQNANKDAALRLSVRDDRTLDLGLAVSRPFENLTLVLTQGGRELLKEQVSVSPSEPWQHTSLRFVGENPASLELRAVLPDGTTLIHYRPVEVDSSRRSRAVATEPPMPEDIASSDELYFTGEHLELYRHPTRYPEPYWEEALRRDPLDARCNTALGRRALSRGMFEQAQQYLSAAIRRLTCRHPNPVTGEAHYYLGLTLRFLGREREAYALFAKAAWNAEWRHAANYELACLDLRRGDTERALAHLDESLANQADNNKARVLRAVIHRRAGRVSQAENELNRLLREDPLDHWALCELSQVTGGPVKLDPSSRNDAQTVLDVAFDYADAGLFEEAIALLDWHHATPTDPVAVPNPLQRSQMTHYTLAYLHAQAGHLEQAQATLDKARRLPPDYCFPSRLHEQLVLQWALGQPGKDRNAAFGLGNYCYDKKRHEDAIALWQRAGEDDPAFATAHRNLGIAYWNVRRDADTARACYQKALQCDPRDSRLIAEYSLLQRKLADPPEPRLAFLEANLERVLDRDDAAVELAALYNETGQPDKALSLLMSRTFHPWEGGEGKVLQQYRAAHLQLGQTMLDANQPDKALEHFRLALEVPDHLGEKYHLLQAKADVRYWQGVALRRLGRSDEAVRHFTEAAQESGDFQDMAVTRFSELSYYKGLALIELGKTDEAQALFAEMKQYAEAEKSRPAKIDYFATSLPNLLVFEDDLDQEKARAMQRLIDLAEQGLNHCTTAAQT